MIEQPRATAAKKKNKEPVRISIAEARAIALHSQGLADSAAPYGLGKDGALRAMQHLGYVQVDTIHVIQRAHHHALWSRVPDYSPAMLHELQSVDYAVFEYWNHAASCLPMRDYRFSLPLMRKYQQQMHWSNETPELTASMRRMLDLIRDKGPVMLSEVESTGKMQGWSNEKLGKIERRSLHELWMRGDIMIRSRQGMQKQFDLTERVLPAGTDTRLPGVEEAAEFHVRKSIQALGIARTPELHYMRDGAQAKAHRDALMRLQESGDLLEVEVEVAVAESEAGARTAAATAWVTPAALQNLTAPVDRGAVRLLSPFDNFTIQRKRLSWLFGFDYTVEIYVPAERRTYGYFVLPVLWGDRIVARMDVKAHRTEKLLLIHNLVFEPDFTDFAGIKPAMAEALDTFARFQQCDTWKIAQATPRKFRLTPAASKPRKRSFKEDKQKAGTRVKDA